MGSDAAPFNIVPFIRRQTGARHAEPITKVQSLWSGYGQITRYQLYGCDTPSIIAKHIQPPTESRHPRGWNTDLGHQRKLRSYEVETIWYQNWAARCTQGCYVPHCLGIQREAGAIIILLEDLDAAGYPDRLHRVDQHALETCLSWLAHFHARFLDETPNGLWPVGTYWHLDTRPDELAAMANGPLKNAASRLDQTLNQARFKTLVHGDAKVANFCFSTDRQRVAAVDFQYVGGGCGIKDVAYFLGSCLTENECERLEQDCLEFYFAAMRDGLRQWDKQVDFCALEAEWRSLFPVAWADFYRFLQGWMPGHKKVNDYSTRITDQVLAGLSL